MVWTVKSRPSRWILAVLAVMINLGGGPVAWAHWLDGAATEAAAMPGECHEHAGAPANGDTPDPGTMPCCQGGDCHCAAPPAVAAIPTPVETRVPHVARPVMLDTSAMPPDPLDDDLRPPIR
jgi:hypothetical protein